MVTGTPVSIIEELKVIHKYSGLNVFFILHQGGQFNSLLKTHRASLEGAGEPRQNGWENPGLQTCIVLILRKYMALPPRQRFKQAHGLQVI